ncbi:MAG: carboxypeptidase regulatory-like domain-containing protein [Planctomycetes bacterium]|nr:carboxypeptidase regulatory-like domain-containing protein [Planctomycetota bacterium]
MTETWRRRQRPVWAWLVGGAVLAALGLSLWALFERAGRGAPAASSPTAPAAPTQRSDRDGAVTTLVAPAAERSRGSRAIGGTVLLPDGQPVAGATVTLLRATTAWPEWRTERVDEAITGPSGTFEFRVAPRQALLVEFQHPSFAGGLIEVPQLALPLRLQLQPGFELFGVVTTPAGAPVSNARVAIEAVIGDDRRVLAVTTSANGAYRFTRLHAGPVRLIARHDNWQPAALPVVVGDQVRRDLTFERPGLPPMRGRVTSLATQAPIAGATIEVLPANARPGLSDPAAAASTADGTFLIAGLPRGTARVLVRHAEYGVVSRTIAVGGVAAELSFELPPRATVTGRLVAEDDPEARFDGEVLQIRDPSGELSYATVAEDGSFRCSTALSPGWAGVRLVGSALAFVGTRNAATAIRVDEAGANDFELLVEPARTVRGRVLDRTGAPLAGATITRTRLLADSTQSIGSALWDLDITQLTSQVAQLFRDDRDELLAVSAADGTFALAGPEPGPLVLRTDLAGHGRRLLRLMVPLDGNLPGLGDVVLDAGCRIEGRVLRGGRGLAGALVTADGGESQAVAVTIGDGTFRFADLVPGDYRLRARLPSAASGSREQRVVTTAPGRPATDVVLALETGRTVRGVVLGSDGQPVPSALVTVRGAVGQTTLTDTSGDFQLELPDRPVELQVSLADRSRLLVVPVPTGQQNVDVQLDTPRTCTVVAQLAGLPGKQRLAGVLVRCVALDGGDGDARAHWLELGNGQLRWSFCPVGRVRLEFWCDGFAPLAVEREFAANETYDLGEVLLETGARLHGVVVDDDGEPVAGAQVWLGEEADVDLFEPAVRTAADGSFRIGGVTSRSARLAVRATGYAPRVQDLVLPRDVLAAAPLRLVLERGATIEVQLPRRPGLEGSYVQLRAGGRVVANSVSDEGGRAWFANRSAGSYTVVLPGSDLPVTAVEVEPGAAVVRVRIAD